MLDYQPLNAARNEIRLLYTKQDSPKTAPSANTTNDQHTGIVQLEMKTVSLDAYTPKSREFMAARGCTTYSWRDYAFPDLPTRIELGSAAEKAAFIEKHETSVDKLFLQPDFGRWVWGDYATLSYTWGDTNTTRPITINEQSLEVTTNLEDFLQGYVVADKDEPSEERMGIWIDAICINQNDMEERNIQVKHMRDIYSSASGAILWLGKAADDSDKAMDMLTSVSQKMFDTREDMVAYMQSIRQNSVFERGSWNALASLLARPYWTRLWVIQEIALSQDSLNIVCGERAINFPSLINAIDTFSNDLEGLLEALDRDCEGSPELQSEERDISEIMTVFNRVQQLRAFRDAVAEGRPHADLKEVLAISIASKQANLKDKVYGILGLVEPRLSKLISPNYALSQDEVYTYFAEAAIRSTGSLDIIISQGTVAAERTLPSWVPDLSADPAVSVEMTMKVPYQASKDSKAVVVIESGHLKARGIVVDVIDGLGIPYSDEYAGENVLQPIHLDTPYEGQTAIREALWRTLFVGRDGASNVVPESYARILEVPWEDDEKDPRAETGFQAVFNDMRRTNAELIFGGQDFKSHFPAKTEEEFTMPEWSPGLDPFHRIFTVAVGRRLAITAKGYFGQARIEAQRGDCVCVLLGCSVPVILRPHDEGLSYELIGESYIHGIMNGEVMDWIDQGQYSLEDLIIC